MKVDFIIENKVSEEDFEDKVFDWLSQGDYTPNDIIENIITEQNLMYFPVHRYQASYQGTVSASLGYQRVEYYYVWNESTKKQDKKSRIVTDWRPHSQNAFGKVSTKVFAGDHKFKFMKSFVETTGWQSNDLITLEDHASRHQDVLSLFNINHVDAWKNSGLEECHDDACEEIESTLPSQLIRNFHANLQISVDNYDNVILPFWVFMYNYNETPYYVAVDGNNPDRVTGIRPKDKKRENKVRATKWIGWLLGVGLGYLGFLIISDKNSDNLLTAVGLAIAIFFAIGIATNYIAGSIKKASKKERQEKLAKLREARRSN